MPCFKRKSSFTRVASEMDHVIKSLCVKARGFNHPPKGHYFAVSICVALTVGLMAIKSLSFVV